MGEGCLGVIILCFVLLVWRRHDIIETYRDFFDGL